MPDVWIDENTLMQWAERFTSARAWLPLLILVIVWIYWARWWRRAHPPLDHPACAACGYDARLLPSPTCPECGADLTGAGVIPPFARRALPRRPMRLAWTLCVVAVAVPVTLGAVRLQLIPRPHDCNGAVGWIKPKSNLYDGAGLTFRSLIGYGNPPPYELIFFSISRDATDTNFARMTLYNAGVSDIPPRANVEVHIGQREQQTAIKTPPDLDDVLSMLRHIGVDTANAQVRREAAELLRLVTDTMKLSESAGTDEGTQPFLARARYPENFTAFGNYSPSSIGYYGHYPAWYALPLLAIWALIWLAGWHRIARMSPRVMPGTREVQSLSQT